MRWFGALSYPLYLYHVWGLSIGTHTGGPVAGVVAALGLAAGSYYVVERPFLALKGRWGRVVSRQSAQAPA
jgi:peptidoglycan/LPS O-acetylase OafA/YrhL